MEFLHVLVKRSKEKIESADGQEFLVYRTVLAGSDIRLTEADAERTSHVRDVRIDKQNRSGNRDLKVDEPIRYTIARFLRLHDGNEEFDCYSFVNLLHRLPLFENKAYLRSRWTLERASGKQAPGAVLFLMNKDGSEFKHAAVCLGSDIFVSVYGKGGQLEFSALNDMRHDFRAEAVFLATPNN